MSPRRIEVEHACGHRVTYAHDLGAFVLTRWFAQAETEPCRVCRERPDAEPKWPAAPVEAVQLALFAGEET